MSDSARDVLAKALQTPIERHDEVLPFDRADKALATLSASGFKVVAVKTDKCTWVVDHETDTGW